MATRPKFSEAQTLESYRIALENAQTHPQISVILNELGYTTEVIGEGKNLLTKTREVYNLNKIEDDETSLSYSNFYNKKLQLENIYNLHRKKAKVIFRNDAVTADRLNLLNALPRTYIKWLEVVKKFYADIAADEDMKTKLLRLKITAEEISGTQNLISELDALRLEYLKEKGESQVATKKKDEIFAKIDDWMSEFYAVVKIGLEDNPQLLEILGKMVRS